MVKNALLVGNGFTSHIIREYTNTYMMDLLKQKEKKIYSDADYLFSVFRRTNGTAAGLSNNGAKTQIIDDLDRLSFANSENVFETYFADYGLIYECNNAHISSVENLLKVISLFQLIDRFSDDDKKKITHTANQLYFNNGNNGLSATSQVTQAAICQFAATYTWIFTTNYDCIFDDACFGSDKVKHIHGGFYFKDRHHTSKEKLSPDDAYLIWGINGEDKERQLKGGLTLDRNHKILMDRTGRFLRVLSVLEKYLKQLENLQISHLDIFGYSGENDQHINKAISRNKNIEQIRYFCKADDVNKAKIQEEIRQRFMLSKEVCITLHSWDEIWSKIPLK